MPSVGTRPYRQVYCRHANSPFWHWAFIEGSRDLDNLGEAWEPVGIVLAVGHADAVDRGIAGKFVERFKDEEN